MGSCMSTFSSKNQNRSPYIHSKCEELKQKQEIAPKEILQEKINIGMTTTAMLNIPQELSKNPIEMYKINDIQKKNKFINDIVPPLHPSNICKTHKMPKEFYCLEERCGKIGCLKCIKTHKEGHTKHSHIPNELLIQNHFFKFLGQGGYGNVFDICAPKKQRIALKMVDLRGFFNHSDSENEKILENIHLKNLENEIALHKKIPKHENIIEYIDSYWIDNKKIMLIEMELAQKNLAQIMKDLTVEDARLIFYYICNGVKHLHQNNIIHRDLKPENILIVLKENGIRIPKIADFGGAKLQLLAKTYNFQNHSYFRGTYGYISPEKIKDETKEFNAASDIWALGIIYHKMLTGGSHPFELKKLAISEKISGLDKEIIEGCLNLDEENRISIQDLLIKASASACGGKTMPIIKKIDKLTNKNLNEFNIKKMDFDHPIIEKEQTTKNGADDDDDNLNLPHFNTKRFLMLELLGKGEFGSVYKAFDNEEKRFVALKIVNMDLSKKSLDAYLNEGKILETLSESKKKKKFIKYYGCFQNIKNEKKQTKQIIFCMQNADASLADLLKFKKKYSDKEIIYILSQIVKCLHEAQGLGISHGDVKLADIVLIEKNSKFKYKLIDFGFGHRMKNLKMLENKLKSKETDEEIYKCRIQGMTAIYAAPELLKMRSETFEDYDLINVFKLDVYAVGILTLKLMGLNESQIEEIKANELDFLKYKENYFILLEIVKQTLVREPEKRVSFENLYEILMKISKEVKEIEINEEIERFCIQGFEEIQNQSLNNFDLEEYANIYINLKKWEMARKYVNIALNSMNLKAEFLKRNSFWFEKSGDVEAEIENYKRAVEMYNQAKTILRESLENEDMENIKRINGKIKKLMDK